MPIEPTVHAVLRNVTRGTGTGGLVEAQNDPGHGVLRSHPGPATSQLDALLPAMSAVRRGAYAAPAKSTVNVLAIDGGGVYDIRAARIIEEIERRAGRPACELFQMIGGTSGGGMLAGALAMPQPLSGAQAVELFRTRSEKIFRRDLWYKLRSFNGLLGKPRYPSEGLDGVLKEFFGDTRMSQAVVDLLIPAYEQDLGPVALTSFPVGEGTQDHLLREATRGSAAVPAFFTPGVLHPLNGPAEKPLKLLDGGLWATNPALVTTQAAKHRNPHASRFNIISIGLGKDRSSNVGEASAKWGLFQWAPYVIGAALTTPERMAEAQIAQYLDRGDVYVRVNPPVVSRAMDPVRGVGAFDDGSRDNMNQHIAQVDAWIAENSEAIDHIVALLTAPDDTPPAAAPPTRRPLTAPVYKAHTTRMLTLAPARALTMIDRR